MPLFIKSAFFLTLTLGLFVAAPDAEAKPKPKRVLSQEERTCVANLCSATCAKALACAQGRQQETFASCSRKCESVIKKDLRKIRKAKALTQCTEGIQKVAALSCPAGSGGKK